MHFGTMASHRALFLLFVVACWSKRVSSLLLSDLATPCLVLDVGSYFKTKTKTKESIFLPPLLARTKEQLWSPFLIPGAATAYSVDATAPPLAFPTTPGACYLHTSVIPTPTGEQQEENVLVRLDLASTKERPRAHLVLGLNNHHVGSYYWARSAGAGSCMDAPGVQVCWGNADDTTSSLQWKSSEGFTECNSNDGKRSEWVPFLRPGDTVQLIPSSDEDANSWLEVARELSWGIYGVSSLGRPMGSEPAVVCEWKK
jgi:hypothetical protein